MDGEVGAEDLCALPEAVQGRDDGAGEELVQERLHEGDLGLRHRGLVTQVRQTPGAATRF